MRFSLWLGAIALSLAGFAHAQPKTVPNQTADRAFLGADGIAAPDAEHLAPGQQRRADIARRTAVLTAAGDARVSRLLGATIHATSGMRLGTVRDVLLGGGGEPLIIVRAAGRTIALPWHMLAFGPPGSVLDGKPVLPDETTHALASMPEFRSLRAGG
jgi:hypothetical protein